jgi:nicotinamidase-related amidase
MVDRNSLRYNGDVTIEISNTATALVVGDMQQGIVRNFGDDAAQLAKVEQAISAARAAGVAVIYVRVGLRDGHVDMSPRNKMFSHVVASGGMLDSSEDTQIHPQLAPRPGDVVVLKRRVGAFLGSDLDVVLRSQGIQRLVLTGIATSGVILSTVRHAADLDYDLVVLSDAVKDGDDEVNRVLLDKLFPRQAEVVTVDEWAKTL